MPRIMFDYVDGAAGDEIANRLNCEQLDRMRLLSRVFVNVDERKISKTLFGKMWGLPFGIAPMGMCNLTWPQADLMLARAAKRFDIPMTLSTMSSTSIEKIAEAAGNHAWFQLYVGQSEEAAFELVDRAHNCGYKTLILTVDVPQVAPRIRDLRNGFKSPLQIRAKQFIDFALHPHWSINTLKQGKPVLANFPPDSFDRDARRGRVDWDFLDRLRQKWTGNLVIKGVLNSIDAERIKGAGADAIYVSNHGGRQLDSAPASIDQLPLIRKAVGDDFPLLFDSGIRNGEGIIKALANGADYVMVGRAMLYGLGADGERGLIRIISILENEISNAMAQLGCTDITHLGREVVVDQ
jgi:L-lactate dehydrogenase (cytochrome)